MADLYKVTYVSARGMATKTVFVSATSDKNAVTAASGADSDFKQHVTAAVVHPNIIAGS
jgi:hypothetical protein